MAPSHAHQSKVVLWCIVIMDETMLSSVLAYYKCTARQNKIVFIKAPDVVSGYERNIQNCTKFYVNGALGAGATQWFQTTLVFFW